MSWRTRLRSSFPYAIAIIGGFLVAYLIVAFIIFPSGVIPRDVRVPNVTGLTFDDAARRLAARGLRAMRGEERPHTATPQGTVLEQSPTAGSRDVEGGTVTLIVSAGQRFASVPRLVGLSLEDAEAALERAGFDVGDVVERASAEPRGRVIESRPAAGAETPMPSAVALVVSAGQTGIPVPDVVGQTVSQARQSLAAAGLTVGDVSTATGGRTADESALVTGQSPAASTAVAPGTPVALQVAGGR